MPPQAREAWWKRAPVVIGAVTLFGAAILNVVVIVWQMSAHATQLQNNTNEIAEIKGGARDTAFALWGIKEQIGRLEERLKAQTDVARDIRDLMRPLRPQP